MSDDLGKLCRRLSKYAHAQLSATDLERIADRIEELEAKLAEAIGALEDDRVYGVITHTSLATLVKLRG